MNDLIRKAREREMRLREELRELQERVIRAEAERDGARAKLEEAMTVLRESIFEQLVGPAGIAARALGLLLYAGQAGAGWPGTVPGLAKAVREEFGAEWRHVLATARAQLVASFGEPDKAEG